MNLDHTSRLASGKGTGLALTGRRGITSLAVKQCESTTKRRAKKSPERIRAKGVQTTEKQY